MSYGSMRIYHTGYFNDTDLPDWYQEAKRISMAEHRDFHYALEIALSCEYIQLTEEGSTGSTIEVRFWPSAHGIFVLIETPLGFVDQIIIPNPADWLPFLSRYLTPLIMASNQSAMFAAQAKMGNAFIAWARHGEGGHVDRESGYSQIDLDSDRERRRLEQTRRAMARSPKGVA